ncbi:hypothetical protein SAMN04488564_10524 [Lentzea waywayandensis]|uniref:Secreted protein n=1 Tax=Lentzea waywayandensis TaxID=84724 RepID=A0A1I6EPX9_9PSEU|nr:hypothetical protein [Lentzea waywayandensis]SFR19804.1 hypothetical protein SAMN04488564_10524 [Lentzea waywayandensis]
MKRPVIAATAVLCLLAAQPASAAWETSRTGVARAKAGTVEALVITSCLKGNPTVVKWDAVPGAAMYTVLWQQGGGAFNKEASTAALTYNVPLAIDRVRVQATVGNWSTSPTQLNCS